MKGKGAGCRRFGVGVRPRHRLLFSSIGAVFFASLMSFQTPSCSQTIVVGSKKFTESYILGEIARKALSDAGFAVEHKQGMGNTSIVWQALKTGQISAYPEYTGTISKEILKSEAVLSADQLRSALSK